MPSKKQTDARVGTFNFSADHGDKFYLQRAHEETEKDGAAEEKRDTETKREEPFQDDRRFYLVILTNLVVTTIVQCQETKWNIPSPQFVFPYKKWLSYRLGVAYLLAN